MREDEKSLGAKGAAALSICESLLLALTDLNVISDEEAHGILTDVIVTHRQAAETSRTPGGHAAVAEIVQRIVDSDNGVARDVARPPTRRVNIH